MTRQLLAQLWLWLAGIATVLVILILVGMMTGGPAIFAEWNIRTKVNEELARQSAKYLIEKNHWRDRAVEAEGRVRKFTRNFMDEDTQRDLVITVEGQAMAMGELRQDLIDCRGVDVDLSPYLERGLNKAHARRD